MSNLPDTTSLPVTIVRGDESGTLDLVARPGDRFFLVVTVAASDPHLAVELDGLANDLGAELNDPTAGRPFHASKDRHDVRARVFARLAGGQVEQRVVTREILPGFTVTETELTQRSGPLLRVDVTVANKATVPARWLRAGARGHERLYHRVWTDHLSRLLPALVRPTGRVRLLIAAIAKRRAFAKAVQGATQRSHAAILAANAPAPTDPEFPHLVFYPLPTWVSPAEIACAVAPASEDRLLQVADYIAWAVRRHVEFGDSHAWDLVRWHVQTHVELDLTVGHPVASAP